MFKNQPIIRIMSTFSNLSTPSESTESSCYRKPKVESWNCQLIVLKVVSSNFNIAGLIDSNDIFLK